MHAHARLRDSDSAFYRKMRGDREIERFVSKPSAVKIRWTIKNCSKESDEDRVSRIHNPISIRSGKFPVAKSALSRAFTHRCRMGRTAPGPPLAPGLFRFDPASQKNRVACFSPTTHGATIAEFSKKGFTVKRTSDPMHRLLSNLVKRDVCWPT